MVVDRNNNNESSDSESDNDDSFEESNDSGIVKKGHPGYASASQGTGSNKENAMDVSDDSTTGGGSAVKTYAGAFACPAGTKKGECCAPETAAQAMHRCRFCGVNVHNLCCQNILKLPEEIFYCSAHVDAYFVAQRAEM